MSRSAARSDGAARPPRPARACRVSNSWAVAGRGRPGLLTGRPQMPGQSASSGSRRPRCPGRGPAPRAASVPVPVGPVSFHRGVPGVGVGIASMTEFYGAMLSTGNFGGRKIRCRNILRRHDDPHPLRAPRLPVAVRRAHMSLLGDGSCPPRWSSPYSGDRPTAALALVLGCGGRAPAAPACRSAGWWPTGSTSGAWPSRPTSSAVPRNSSSGSNCSAVTRLDPRGGGGAVGGTASAFAIPTASPLVAGTVERGATRQRANALMGITANTEPAVGPALAGDADLGRRTRPGVHPGRRRVRGERHTARVVRVRNAPLPRPSSSPTCRKAGARYVPATGSGQPGRARRMERRGRGPGHPRAGRSDRPARRREICGSGFWRPGRSASFSVPCWPRGPGSHAPCWSPTSGWRRTRAAGPARRRRPAPLVIAAYGVALTALGYLNPVWETVVQHIPARGPGPGHLVRLAGVARRDAARLRAGPVRRRRVRRTRPAGRRRPAGARLLRGHRPRSRRTPTHLADHPATGRPRCRPLMCGDRRPGPPTKRHPEPSTGSLCTMWSVSRRRGPSRRSHATTVG